MTDINKAFNEGCDARLEGKSVTANPYGAVTRHAMSWLMGWKDVDLSWAFDARRPMPLPPVKE